MRLHWFDSLKAHHLVTTSFTHVQVFDRYVHSAVPRKPLFFSFLPHFVVTCDLFLNRGTVTWSSFVNQIVTTKNFPLRHTLYYRFRPFSRSWWTKIDVRERVSVGSDSVSSSRVEKNQFNSCYGWKSSNYNRSSMVCRWISLSQWSEILGHGEFQTRFWNNRTKCYSSITNMLQKKWILAVWKLYGAAHLTSSLLLRRFLHTDSYLFISCKKKKKKKKKKLFIVFTLFPCCLTSSPTSLFLVHS